MKTLVVSPGGMGSNTALLSFARLGETNAFGDLELQHCYPADQARIDFAPDRIVYVWNDPLLAVLSVWSRDFNTKHHQRLARDDARQFEFLSELWTMTVREGRDVYGIDRHVAAWSAESPELFDWRSVNARPRANHYENVLVPAEVRRIYSDLDRRVRDGFPV